MKETSIASSLYWRRTTLFFITKLPVVVCDSSSWTIAVIGDNEHFLDAMPPHMRYRSRSAKGPSAPNFSAPERTVIRV